MKTNKLKVSIMLILSLLIINSIASNTDVNKPLAKTSLSSPSNQVLLEDLIVKSPMFIDYDANFTDYGFPGEGTPVDPYRIENYNITTSGISCLSFGGYTTKHFIIKNCFLKTDKDYAIFIGTIKNLDEGSVSIEYNEINSTGTGGLIINGHIDSGTYKNEIFTLDCGISLRDSPFTYSKGNKIVGPIGISLLDSYGATLINNICNETTEVGISITNSPGTIIAHNNCSNNADTGILTENSHNLIISNNYIMNNFYGMRIINSSSSLITNNSFTASTSYGLSMTLSEGLNKIYHNAFYDNNLGGSTIQALDDAGDQWYNEVLKEGNFWNDWNGAASATYTIDGAAGSEDLYPLDYVPQISEFTKGYIFYIIITMFLAIPLVVYSKKRK